MKHLVPKLIVGFVVLLALTSTVPAAAAPVTGFDPGRIIDDDVFTASGSMTAAQIQAFFNSKVPVCDTMGTQPSEYGGGTRAQWGAAHNHPTPFTCIKDYSENGMSAAQIIYNVAQRYQINPQVLIVLLQKEQGLITDTWPVDTQYKTATGYGCPDTAACDSKYYGLTAQLTWAATMFHAIASNSQAWSNTYASGTSWYTPYVMGNNFIQYNPQSSCNGSTVNITTRATQALYNYTPYQPNQASLNAGYGTGDSCSSYGNRNFYLYFTDWFGSTQGNSYYTCFNGSNIQNTSSGQKLLPNRNGTADTLSLFITNNTSTKCAEAHTWLDSSLQTWVQHVGTNSYTFDPLLSTVLSMKVSPTRTQFYKVDLTGTGSGRLEVHGWDTTVQHWTSHVATVAAPISPTDSTVLAADTNGDGIDELYIVNYRNTASGMVEVHGLSSNFQQWTMHTATNLPVIDPTKGKIIAADVNGDGKDEFVYVKYAEGASGMIELHVWSPSLQQWTQHIATNLATAGYNKNTDDIIAANLNGSTKDQLFYVKYSNTASGRVEVHGWNDTFSQWVSHVATSAGSF